MLKVGASVLSLELPEEARHTAPPAMASAGMTPPPRSRAAPPISPAPPSVKDDVASSAPYVDPSAPTNPMPRVDAQISAAERAQRKAWKKSGVTFGKATGIAILAVAGLAILGALFVVFSLME
jgi:hypothetical protein